MKACDRPKSEQADLALLFLAQELDASVVPAVFASKALIDRAKTVRVVGFGRDQRGRLGQKQFVDIPLASASCSGSVVAADGKPVPDSTYYGCNANFELVAGAPLLDKDSCQGDSGGPLFIRDSKGNDYFAAATSRRVATAGARPCGDGGIYVRVDGDTLAWIRKQGVAVTVSP